jgi:hypothetical protein
MVYCAALDAEKAFDRVNHYKLFSFSFISWRTNFYCGVYCIDSDISFLTTQRAEGMEQISLLTILMSYVNKI